MPDRTKSAGPSGSLWPDAVLSFLGVLAVFAAAYFFTRSA